ncbi:hydroxylysine kinase-like isoform X2 [Convolutriloba macropyga]|uniref:hydroxylysine kinase-like isoform X2 n=1 Tax=Convolutriloba macropyga TaxID=536237 RepID=UPI003F526E84
MDSCDSDLYVYNAPIVEEDEIRSHLKNIYDIEAKSVKRLIGYDSANFLVSDARGQKMLFKVLACTNPEEIAEFLHHQIDMMKYLATQVPEGLIQGIVTPMPESKTPSSSVISIKVRCKKYPDWCDSNCYHNAVVVRYVPGEVMTNFSPFSTRLLESVGEKFGILSKALQTYKNEVVWNRTEGKWDPKNVLKCEKFLIGLAGVSDERMKLCQDFFERYSKETLPFIEGNCRRGLIHSDGNPNNILVRTESADEVSTILDFEDACSSFIVFECGSLLMYAICYMIKGDYALIGAHIMKGFCKHQPLTEPEWTVLFDSVLARIIQSSIYGLHAASLNPENSEYILESQEESWAVLELLARTDRNSLVAKWKELVVI